MPSPMLITRSSVPSESCADQSEETSGPPITAHLEPVPAAEHAEVDEEDVEDHGEHAAQHLHHAAHLHQPPVAPAGHLTSHGVQRCDLLRHY